MKSRPLGEIIVLVFLVLLGLTFILLVPRTYSQQTVSLQFTKEFLLKLSSDNLGLLDQELAQQLRRLNPQYSHIVITHDDPQVTIELGQGRKGPFFTLRLDKYQLNKLAMDSQNLETGQILAKISQNSNLGEMAFQRVQNKLSLYIPLRPGMKAVIPPPTAPGKTPPPPPPPPAKAAKPAGEEEALVLWAVRVTSPPAVDGFEETLWEQAPSLLARVSGPSGDREVELKACYTDTHFYLLASWWDNTKNETHLTWVWNKGKNEYVVGNDRQDALALMWAFKGRFSACMTDARDSASDLWLWGAAKTNPSGYAENDLAIISTTPLARANAYKGRWLKVVPKTGELPYKSQIPLTHEKDFMPHYLPQTPTEGAANVRARGRWSDNSWRVEFGRRLKTGYDDDVVLQVGKPVAFAVAVFDHRDGNKHSISKELTLRWR